MKNKRLFILAMAFIMLFALGQSVGAFQDISNHPNAEKINELKERGVVNGYPKDKIFVPRGKLTYAAGISMIVKAFDLNIDHMRFLKQPLASDTYPNLKNDAWYSDAFIIAYHSGLEVPEQVKENDHMTKEQFAHHLFQAILTKGDYAFIEIYKVINDETDINPDYMNSIQKLLIANIATVDKKLNFSPKDSIRRGTAASWLHDGLKFVENNTSIEVPVPTPPIYDYTLTVEQVTKDVNKVTISTQMPHPGYGIRISSIVFEGNQAVIKVDVIDPDPDRMYPQVITDVSISTYVDAAFKPVLK